MTTQLRGAVEYRSLSDALEYTTPPCANDWRFIVDSERLGDDDKAQMRSLCRQCPLAEACRTYATIARPKAGMWAGRYWGRKARSEDS